MLEERVGRGRREARDRSAATVAQEREEERRSCDERHFARNSCGV